jgi:curved DNA-binding protein CbpA
VAEARVPKLVSGVGDVRSMPLAPVDGFVLSRVDGAASTRDIAATTGLGESVVEESLKKLVQLGVVEFPGEKNERAELQRRIPTNPPPKPSSAPPGPNEIRNPHLIDRPLPKETRYDARELDEICDLELAQKHRVLDLYYRLDELDFYSLLAVPRSADRKAIKRAYFELAAHFHPDKFFRKTLGSFKQKMEIIFGRVTEAHDTLADKDKRPEYDEYLSLQAQSRGMEEIMASAAREVELATEEIARQTGSVAPPSSAPPPPPDLAVAPPQRPPPDLTPADPRELREALARRLRGASARASPARTAPLPTMSYVSTQEAMDALKRRYDERRSDAMRQQSKKYRDVGDLARAANDMVSAANAYRVAASLSPDDVPLQKLAQATAEAAENVLVETYQKQALYEERNGRWADAVKTWQRVARNRPTDSKVWDKLARALLEAGGDLHEASDAAKRAIEYGSAIIAYRLTLIEIYIAAGLSIAAKRDLEQVARMEPGNAQVEALLKRLQKAQ